jgi:hypothetical protein
MKHVANIILISGAITVVAFIAFILFAFRSAPMESAKHLARVDWLPSEASDVTYAKRKGFGWFTCYECSMPREAFDRLARKEGWQTIEKIDVRTEWRSVLDLSTTRPKREPDGVVALDLRAYPNNPV